MLLLSSKDSATTIHRRSSPSKSDKQISRHPTLAVDLEKKNPSASTHRDAHCDNQSLHCHCRARLYTELAEAPKIGIQTDRGKRCTRARSMPRYEWLLLSRRPGRVGGCKHGRRKRGDPRPGPPRGAWLELRQPIRGAPRRHDRRSAVLYSENDGAARGFAKRMILGENGWCAMYCWGKFAVSVMPCMMVHGSGLNCR